MEILKCSNLKKQIKNKIIVENISFSINKGDIVGFIGPNGAGKTTIIKLILGLMKLSEGKVFINGFDIEKDFIKVMDDDFNVQNGISVVYEMAKQLNVYSEKEKVYTDTINNLINTYKKVVEIFGISFSEEKELLDDTIEQLIQERNEARKNKNFKRSDEIRDLLKEQGIILEDTAQGTRWKRND